MRGFLKQRFVWQFVGGFALGAAGMVALQPGALPAAAATVAQHAR